MSQSTAILEHLKSGHHITPLRALTLFRCMRLAPRIKELRQAGYRIETTMETLPSGKRIASYHMPPDERKP